MVPGGFVARQKVQIITTTRQSIILIFTECVANNIAEQKNRLSIL